MTKAARRPRGDAGFSIIQALLLLAGFAALALYVEGMVQNTIKFQQSVAAADELDALATQVSMALRDSAYCNYGLVPAGAVNMSAASGTPVTIYFPNGPAGGAGQAVVQPNSLVALTFVGATLVGIRQTVAGGGNWLAEIHLKATPKNGYGSTMTSVIPTYVQPGGSGIAKCFTTTYLSQPPGSPIPVAQLTFEDNICTMAQASGAPGTPPPPPGPPVPKYFDPWPPTNGNFCN